MGVNISDEQCSKYTAKAKEERLTAAIDKPLDPTGVVLDSNITSREEVNTDKIITQTLDPRRICSSSPSYCTSTDP